MKCRICRTDEAVTTCPTCKQALCSVCYVIEMQMRFATGGGGVCHVKEKHG